MKVNLQSLRRTFRRMVFASASVLAAGLGNLHAQVYLAENFDSAFVGSPAAPPGWTQERLGVYGNIAPGALNAAGIRDWQQNINTGAATWSLVPTTVGVVPSAAVNGTGVLWFNESNASPVANFYMRRMASPAINLAAAISPYVKFSYFNANGSNTAYGVKVMASSDNGATWKLIMVVQPNAQVGNTANSSTTLTSATPWQRIAVKIPSAFLTANTKIALVQNNPNSFGSNSFIDSLSVEEFTPTTITSAQTGNWNDPLTWVGGVVPTSENHVVIAAGHTVSMNANICRAQDVNVDGTLNFAYTTTLQSGQFFGNLNIGATGLVTAGSGTTGKPIYIGGNFNNAGTANFQVSTASNLIMYGGSAATITNTGTITNGYFSVITHGNSGGITYNSPITIRNTCNLFEGNVNPNSNLTLGVTANTNVIQRNSQSQFTSAPTFASLGASARNVSYVTFTNQTITQQVIVPGDEVENLSGTRTITGTFTINTQDRVELGFPLTIGTATTGGATFSRGILVSSATNMLTFNLTSTGAFGATPNTATPTTTHGSYVVGPVRYNRPATGTASINLPFGVGTDYLAYTPTDNVIKQFTITPGGTWGSQTPIIELINAAPTGSGTGVNVLGNRYLAVDLNGGPDLPATATLTFPAMNYTFGTGANTDNLFGTQDQLRVIQNTTATGTTWAIRSNTVGTGAIAANTLYTRTTVTAAPGPIAPIATNGGVFAIGTTAARMVVDSVVVTRDLNTISIGTINQAIVKLAVWVSGVVPVKLTNATFNTTGSTNVADITNAKLYTTGSTDLLFTTTPVGSTIASPSGAMVFNGDLTLNAGVNYLWLTYDVSGSATLGNTLAADLTSVTVDAITSNPTNPAAGGRVVSAPMTYVSTSATQTVFSKVDAPSTNARILDVVVTMSATGAPIALTQMDFNTNGGNNPLTNISNAKLYFTGASNTFSSASLVGTAVSPNGAFSITGNASLVNGANHFWLTYDVPASATPGDSVDAELVAVTVGSSQAAVYAPAGVRYIKAAYCATSYPSGCGTDNIARVRLGTLDNSTGCAAGAYTYFSGLTAPSLIAGIPYTMSLTYGSHGTQYGWAWVDWNDDGDFTDAGESLGSQVPANAGANGTSTITVTVPCSVTPGIYRLRIRGGDDAPLLATHPCGASASTWGETEDYNIQVVSGNPSHLASQAIQFTGTASAGVTDRNVLRIPIKVIASSCVPAVITQFNFSTTGTTSNADIASAKLYKTGASSTFSTANLVGTVNTPSTNFSFVVSDTANNDTNNYWLTYDISGAAANGNIVDAVIDSIQLFGSWVIPTDNNPTGNVLVSTPMTYISSTVEHTNTTKVGLGSTNNDLLRLRVITSSIGAPINVTALNFSSNGGGVDSSNISNAKVYYTGSNPNFSAVNQFGTTYSTAGLTTAAIGAFSFTGSQALLNDTNYFWLTYDIKSAGVIGDSVDAELTNLTVAGNVQTPTVSAPAGNRKIRAEYCAANHTSTFYYACFSNVTFNTINNTTGTTCGLPVYTLQSATTTVLKNTTYTLSLNATVASGTVAGAWFDWNDNGTFEPSEYVSISTNSTTNLISTQVTVPCNAAIGTIRMRVRTDMTFGNPLNSSTPCSALFYGETEDYIITVADNPVAYASSQALTGSALAVVGQGATDFPVMRLKVKGAGCGIGTITELRFNTAATTTPSNITSAKLYKTSGATFNTTNLIGTVASPSGQFLFTISDTLITNDTNNFWLAYDVAAGASSGNVLDAAIDSIQVMGAYYIPTNSNPAGTYTIQSPMTFVASNTFAVSSAKVGTNSVNNPVIGYQVEMSATGAPVDFTSITVNTTGTPNLADITNLKVFYTGNTNTFSPNTQFGSTVATPAASNVITSVMSLTNGVNYFWITYDIPTAATLGDTVDAEVTTATVAGVAQVPASTTAAGFRVIRADYCTAPYSTGKTAGDLLSRVRIIGTTFDNNSGTAPVNPSYTYFTGQPNYTATLIQGSIYQVEVTIGSFQNQGVAAWLDYNDDGIFQTTERIGFTNGQINVGFGTATFPIALTCEATPGVKRLRVRCNYAMNGNLVNPCASYTWGECEDYDVTIGVNPGVYGYSTAKQITGTVPPGAMNAPVLRIPVTATGCTPITTNSFNFNGTGTTNMADILSAKIYKTGNSTVFSTTNLVGTVSNPGSVFSIAAIDTLLNGFTDTNNYWLAVDVAAGATTFNTIDAQAPSLVVNGITYTPADTNPTGNLVIQPPMTYLSSNSTMPSGSAVSQSSKNNVMARIMVVTSSTGAPIPVTSIEANTTALGASNIDTAEVWYTGSSPFFIANTQFGASIANPSGLMTFTGSQNLTNDTNYFWLTYDLKTAATIGDSVDADVSGITVATTNYIPTLVAGADNRKIIAPYCELNLHSSTCVGNDIINNVSTTGGLTNISNLNSGCSPAPTGNYAFYSSQTLTAYAGGSFTINYQAGPWAGGFRIYADYNQDGDFFDAGEEIAYAPSSNALNSTVVSVPITALTGTTRLRVRVASFGDVTGPCTNHFNGETEDYNLNIVPLPAPTTYTWNQTAAADFNTASNWTPSRSVILGNDKLLFNSGVAVTVTNLPTQTVGELTIANNTTVEFTGSTGILTTPVLTLTAGTFKTNTARINVGLDTVTLGTITGTGTIEGNMGRYVNSTSTVVNFPLSQGANTRSLDITFTTAPVIGGLVQASFATGTPSSAGLPLTEGAITANKVSREGLWRLISGVSGSTYSIAASGAGMVGITDYQTTVLARRSGTFGNWTLTGTHATTTGSNAAPVFNRTGLTVFGEFAMIADSAVNPLPVRMLSFDVANVGGDVKLSWSTSSEQNNKGFEVERSIDGKRFSSIGFVKGAGNSSVVIRYNSSDNRAFSKTGANTLYYRLKQVDMDGRVSYTDIRKVSSDRVAGFEVIAYPVPFDRNFNLSISSVSTSNAIITVYDMQGRLISSKEESMQEGINTIGMSELEQAKGGVYFVKVTQAGQSKMVRVVKTN